MLQVLCDKCVVVFSFFNRNNYIRAFAVLSMSHYTIMKDFEIVKKTKRSDNYIYQFLVSNVNFS